MTETCAVATKFVSLINIILLAFLFI